MNRWYECTENTSYRADISLGSKQVGLINCDEVIFLEEIHDNVPDQRIRGRTPKGWVSLENTESGHVWFHLLAVNQFFVVC